MIKEEEQENLLSSEKSSNSSNLSLENVPSEKEDVN
jgi:hypothetical protein